MSILPKLVSEIIDYYLWKSRVRYMHREYHEIYSETNDQEFQAGGRLLYPHVIGSNKRSCVVRYMNDLVGWRWLEPNAIGLRSFTNLLDSGVTRTIYNFVKGKIVAELPKNYVWSIEDLKAFVS